MSYYILPKNNNVINVSPIALDDCCEPYISFSLLSYYSNIKTQIEEMFVKDVDLSNNNFEEAIQIINPYEFIFSKVPGSKFSVSKLKPKTNLFYDLLELSSNLNLFDTFKNKKPIQFIHISPNYDDSIECVDIFREGFDDCHNFYEKVDIDSDINYRGDFIFYETNTNNYFYSLIVAVLVILKNQKFGGNCVIKISHTFYKPVIDIIYLICSLYDKVYICKPNTNNVSSFDKYLVCKEFQYDESEENNKYLKINYIKLVIFLKRLGEKNINRVLEDSIPYYFKTKIDDLNIIIGQQQLDALDQIITIYKNKNKDDKIDTIRKNNIQKSVIWCEKYKIPCNKFTEKLNIFLPITPIVQENPTIIDV